MVRIVIRKSKLERDYPVFEFGAHPNLSFARISGLSIDIFKRRLSSLYSLLGEAVLK